MGSEGALRILQASDEAGKFGLLTSATRRPGTKYCIVATTRGSQWGDGDQMADPRWQTNGDATHGTTTAVFAASASSRLRASFLPGWSCRLMRIRDRGTRDAGVEVGETAARPVGEAAGWGPMPQNAGGLWRMWRLATEVSPGCILAPATRCRGLDFRHKVGLVLIFCHKHQDDCQLRAGDCHFWLPCEWAAELVLSHACALRLVLPAMISCSPSITLVCDYSHHFPARFLVSPRLQQPRYLAIR